MIYQVYVNNDLIKEYTHRIQAIIWLMMHGYIYSGNGLYFMSHAAKIKTVITTNRKEKQKIE
jgi:hypothetical protein